MLPEFNQLQARQDGPGQAKEKILLSNKKAHPYSGQDVLKLQAMSSPG